MEPARRIIELMENKDKKVQSEGEIEALHKKPSVIQAAIAYIHELFSADTSGHDAAHTMRVYRNALIISGDQEVNMLRVSLAALLHDADDHKLFHTEKNANARAFLSGQQVPDAEIEEICRIINAVSFSQNQKDRTHRPETLEAQIVQDADRLDAMGAVGIARTFAYGGAHGRELEESVQHFHKKLLKLKDLMNTEKGREMAGHRHDVLVRFLAEFEDEMEETR